MSKRKRYSPEFKREAIDLVCRSGASCRPVALEIGVAPNLLTRWVRPFSNRPWKCCRTPETCATSSVMAG
ncbi:transposase [Pseudomonas aeruginosa]|uniref:transposase n=1 Tax=Pseudomonas aeruginosa TaxID=287 RepID=UPI0015937519